MTKNDYKFFNKAKIVANISDYNKVHVGCVAVYQGYIVGIGCNTNKTHPSQKYYNKFRGIYTDDAKFAPKIHAEINCINAIKRLKLNFSKVRLYIYRTRVDREYGLARPCAACLAAIQDLGIKHIYYTTDNGYANEKLVYLSV